MFIPPPSAEYILYACIHGDLEEDLIFFWEACQNQESYKNEAVTVYPPHISLTGFFPQVLEEADYIESLNQSIAAVPVHPSIGLRSNEVLHRKTFHAVYFQSEYLKSVTEIFAQKIGLPSEKIKPALDYHLTLAHNFRLEANQELQGLEKQIDFSKSFKASLCLFKSEEEQGQRKLTKVYSKKI